MIPAIALNRFGLGARPDDDIPDNPRRWLFAQLNRFEARSALWAALPSSSKLAADYIDDGYTIRTVPDASAKMIARKRRRAAEYDVYLRAVQVRAASALSTTTPFVERVVHFWANHFAVSADKGHVVPFIGTLEAEAIRPHVLGRFEDMLLAVVQHPAMQLYLDQTRSVGPKSALATHAIAREVQGKPGLNENLAREILELHTLGPRTGYTQTDVTEFALALTGWSIGGLGRGRARPVEVGRFVFRSAMHEPGNRIFLGNTYPQPGEGQARAILQDLAVSSDTAYHIAMKLARHFVADDPPAALVNRLKQIFIRTGGDLPALYHEIVSAPESANMTAIKFKTPWEWLISSLRGLRISDPAELRIASMMQQLGQPVWRPGSPAGFDDIAASWAAPAALLRRVELAQRLAVQVGNTIDPRLLAPKILPGVLSDATAQCIAKAENLPSGLTLLLVSPDFLRR